MIKKIFIALILSVFFISSYTVDAATQINPTATYYSFRLCNINKNNDSESNCNWSAGTEVGTNTTPGTNLYATGFRVNMLFGNDTFKPDNTYTITLKMAINKPIYFSSILDSPLSSKSLEQSCLGTTGSDCSNANFKNISARVTNESGNTFDYVITFSPAIETKYFRFAVYNNNPLYNGLTYDNTGALLYKAMTYGRLNGFSATYESGVGSIIENSTIIIQNQNNQLIDGQNQINNNLDNINGSINDSDVSESESAFGDFFNGFTTNTHGLTGIITSPLQLIGSITSSTCSDLVLPLPYVNKNLSLPCMSSIYYEFFGDFFILYQTITFGIISYWVIIRIFNLVKDFKNPEHDEIEVLEL